jgi:hypothetical protein
MEPFGVDKLAASHAYDDARVGGLQIERFRIRCHADLQLLGGHAILRKRLSTTRHVCVSIVPLNQTPFSANS